MIILVSTLSWILLIGFPLYGLRRGSGVIFCTGLILLVAHLLALGTSPMLAREIALVPSADQTVNAGWWRVVIFVPCFLAAFPLGHFLNRMVALSFEPFDHVLGMVLGLIVAAVVLNGFFGAVLYTVSSDPQQHAYQHLFLARQFVYLDGVHSIQGWFNDLTRPAEPINPS